MSDELRDLISQAQQEVNPDLGLDNQELVEDTEELEVIEEEVEDTFDEDNEELDTEGDEEDESEDTSDADGNSFTVKVNGEEFKVSEKELKAGYQRQADYTREKQALKAQAEEFEQVKVEYAEQFTAIQELDAAWEESPAQVLAHFASSTENPTQAVAELIRDLAADNKLDRQFLEIFGITPEIQAEWRSMTEVERLRKTANRSTNQRDTELEEAKMEVEVQRAIVEYDKQIDEIIDNEGYNFNTKQRTAFRTELAQYAAENDLTNLKAAYKAFKYEESLRNKKLAAKTVEKAKAKKATNVVGRSGSGEGSSLSDTSDLNAVIRQAMKEAGN
jgi:hypothetical protein